MRTISSDIIKNKVCELFIQSNYRIPDDIYDKIKRSAEEEKVPIAQSILNKLIENCAAAERMNIPVCQDTGMAIVFIEIGQDVHIEGALLSDAVNAGVKEAYDKGYMRKSIVRDPLFDRTNTDDNTPAIIYTSIVPGDKVKITAVPKGFGSENMSSIRMFTPSAKREDIVNYIIETVKKAGSNPCPPIIVGIGLGGDFEYAALLSKKALLRDISEKNKYLDYAELEAEILEKINRTNIGPQGFGGNTTCLAVNIEHFPTHIAGLPCAVNIGCHVTRHASEVI